MSLLKTVDHRGLSLPSVGLGTWAIGGPYWTDGEPTGWGGPLDDDDSVTGLRLGLDAGLVHIDTADAYGHGRSERLVGKAIAGRSEATLVASKVGFIATSAPSVFSPENIRFQFEQTLRNLNRDRIDLYYAHHCDFGEDDEFLDDAAAELHKLRDEGLVGCLGLSGYSAADLMRVADTLEPDFIQSWASIEHPEFVHPDGELAPYMLERDIGFIAMMPYGQGRLLGKYTAGEPPTFDAGDNRNGNFEFEAQSLEAIEPALSELRERFGETPADLITPALGFLLHHEVVKSVIPGFRNSRQVRELISAIGRPFTDEDQLAVNALFPFDAAKMHPWAE